MHDAFTPCTQSNPFAINHSANITSLKAATKTKKRFQARKTPLLYPNPYTPPPHFARYISTPQFLKHNNIKFASNAINLPDSLTYGLTHLAIAVKDIERTKVFYQAIFDMEVMYQHNAFLQLTTPGCYDIIVFEERNDAPVGETAGIAHFGFRLKRSEDIEIILRRIVEAGGVIIDQGEFVKGSPYVFFKDPDGYEVEVWYELLKEGTGNE